MSKRPTLEQQRAQDAWNCVKVAQEESGISYGRYVIAAKGFPILIMNSGLMQMLAFAEEKKKEQQLVACQLRAWLSKRFPKVLKTSNFPEFMRCLMSDASPQDYQAINAEALAWLKWMRQIAAAQKGEE